MPGTGSRPGGSAYGAYSAADLATGYAASDTGGSTAVTAAASYSTGGTGYGSDVELTGSRSLTRKSDSGSLSQNGKDRGTITASVAFAFALGKDTYVLGSITGAGPTGSLFAGAISTTITTGGSFTLYRSRKAPSARSPLDLKSSYSS